jgi:hypothetical protein
VVSQLEFCATTSIKVAMKKKLMDWFMFPHRSVIWEESTRLNSQQHKYTFTCAVPHIYLKFILSLEQPTIIDVLKYIIHITKY